MDSLLLSFLPTACSCLAFMPLAFMPLAFMPLTFMPLTFMPLTFMQLAQGLDVALRNRLVLTTVAFGAVIACLAILYAYLRLEHATRGFYSGRLQTGAGFSGLAVLVVAYFVWLTATA